MAENEFEQVAIKCVDEIMSFQHLANAMEETLTEWNSKLHEKTVEYQEHWDTIKEAHDDLIKALNDEAQQQSEEVGKITQAAEEATESLHKLLAKATEQHVVLEESTSVFGTTLKDYVEKQKARQSKQADVHQMLMVTFEDNSSEIDEAGEQMSTWMGALTSKVSEHSEHAAEHMSQMHELLDQHHELAGQEFEALAQHLDEAHDNAKQKLTEHEAALLEACEEVAHALEEGLGQGIDLLANAAEALGADFSGLREKVEEIAGSLQETADDVDEELQTTTQGMEKSIATLGGLQKLLEKFG